MGSLIWDEGSPEFTHTAPRMLASDREQLEIMLRSTRNRFEPEEAKLVMLDMLEGYEKMYARKGGVPADISELRSMVQRDMI